MRVIGGMLSGRRIEAPAGSATRPTSDRIREAIFNRLAHGAFDLAGDPLEGLVLDLFAGSGGLGIEALSRGAARCDFVDASVAAATVIKRNLDALGIADRGHIKKVPADAFLRRCDTRYDLVFADPPYADAGPALDRVLALLVDRSLLQPTALLIVEHGADPAPKATRGEQAGLYLVDQRRYGQTLVSFLSCGQTPTS